MEENKKRALEKLQQKKVLLQQQNPAQKSNSKVFNKTSQSSFYATLQSSSSNKPSQSSSSFYGTSTSSPSSGFSKPKVTGKCVLLSRDRFTVELRFHEGSIGVFKSISSGRYNASDRTWSFHIDDHDELLKKLRPLLPDLSVEGLPKWIMETFSAKKSTLKLVTEDEEDQVEPDLWQALMPFQREGVRYALKRRGRVLLADDMGLGKTVQSLAIVSAYKSLWPLLIVCPSSMRFAWKCAVVRWLPSVPEEEIVVVTCGKDELSGHDIMIISYDLLARKRDELVDMAIKAAILDESHFVKGHKTNRAKAAECILKHAKVILLLSGTPALSKPIELYPQISLIEPKLFPYATDFGMRYCNGRKVNFGRVSHYDFQGSSNMNELKLLLEERFMLRRIKADVLAQLPAKLRQMVILDPTAVKSKSKEMQSQAKMMEDRSLNKSERRGVLLEWYHSTAAAKAAAVQDYIKDLLESNRKFICFAHHQTMMNCVAEQIEKCKVQYMRIDGATASGARKEACDAFQTDDNVRVALLSITAANAGITLTAAQLVVFAELFWNPGILTQAEDRAHRIGQTDSVIVQYLVATGTADDELWPLIQKKLDVLNKAGLSKDNFMESESHRQTERQRNSSGESKKITDYFSTSLTEEDLAALDQDWDSSSSSSSSSDQEQDLLHSNKKPKL